MLFGRIVGWILVIGGVVMLQGQGSAWAGLASWTEGSVPWDVAVQMPFDYISQSLGESLSAAMASRLVAAVTILIGVLMAWVCRRRPHHA